MGPSKFHRNYQLFAEKGYDPLKKQVDFLLVQPKIAVDFDVHKNIAGGASSAVFRIYNLSENNRNYIRKDRQDLDIMKEVMFKAGYQDRIYEIFFGDIMQSYSVREGNTDWVTTIIAYDSGAAFSNGYTGVNLPADTPKQSLFRILLQSLGPYNVQIGAIGNYQGSILKGNSYQGNPIELVKELSGNGLFFNNKKAYVLRENEVISGSDITVNADTGLLDTPVIENSFISFKILFEPRIQLGQKIKVESATFKQINSFYRVNSIHHEGKISETVCGEATTTIGCIRPPIGFIDFSEVI